MTSASGISAVSDHGFRCRTSHFNRLRIGRCGIVKVYQHIIHLRILSSGTGFYMNRAVISPFHSRGHGVHIRILRCFRRCAEHGMDIPLHAAVSQLSPRRCMTAFLLCRLSFLSPLTGLRSTALCGTAYYMLSIAFLTLTAVSHSIIHGKQRRNL